MSCSLVQNADQPVGVANLPNARKKLVVNEADVLVCRELFKQSSLPIARMALDQREECQFAVIVLDCVEAARLDLVEGVHGVAPWLFCFQCGNDRTLTRITTKDIPKW